MKILLHICCAPCLIGPYERLAEEGHEVTALFFNPNIHPLIEFRRRLKAVKVLQERMPVPVIFDESYGLVQFLHEVDWDSPRRCRDCYRLRLNRTARQAVEGGFDAFSTTLLASRQQDHDLVRSVGTDCARKTGSRFLAEDWRPLADQGHDRARDMRLYLQGYCGCVFSEWERFRDTTRHLYRGGSAHS